MLSCPLSMILSTEQLIFLSVANTIVSLNFMTSIPLTESKHHGRFPTPHFLQEMKK